MKIKIPKGGCSDSIEIFGDDGGNIFETLSDNGLPVTDITIGFSPNCLAEISFTLMVTKEMEIEFPEYLVQLQSDLSLINEKEIGEESED